MSIHYISPVVVGQQVGVESLGVRVSGGGGGQQQQQGGGQKRGGHHHHGETGQSLQSSSGTHISFLSNLESRMKYFERICWKFKTSENLKHFKIGFKQVELKGN